MNRFEQIKKHFEKIKKNLLDTLLPIECVGCGGENIWLCDKCLKKIQFTLVDKCVVCKKPADFGITHQNCKQNTWLDGIIIVANWDDTLLQKVIHKFKYNFIQNLSFALAEILISKIRELKQKPDERNPVRLFFNHNLIVIPVPLHKKIGRAHV